MRAEKNENDNRNISNTRGFLYFSLFVIAMVLYGSILPAEAKVTGNCVNCHTMHNSQNGQPMRRDSAAAPLEMLLRSTCIGCHGQNTSNNIDPTTGAPQVLHTNPNDLAGGNFAYITGAKSRITADQNSAGHNVIDLGSAYHDTVLISIPPGWPSLTGNHVNYGEWNGQVLTCAGYVGCHGSRIVIGVNSGVTGLPAIKGAHHGNSGPKKVASDMQTNNMPANGYRFLVGVSGLENTGWQNSSSNSHNEYFGAITPMNIGPSAGFPCQDCHPNSSLWSTPIQPINHTMSGFCGSCHGIFHGQGWISGNTPPSSPFTRHPTDVILPSSGEYSAYTTYSIVTPVARTTVPDFSISVVQPGADVIMCLSCHMAHASPYFKMMRWDYKGWPANGQTNGCNVCHTSKN